MTDLEFQTLKDTVYSRFGILLGNDKKSIILNRIKNQMYKLNYETFGEYFNYVKNDKSGKALTEFTNDITINHTYFFREKDHFDFLQTTALPKLAKMIVSQNSKNLRIWSAAASSGEEPYTIAMVLMEYFKSEYILWNAGVLGTDLSDKVIKLANKGQYHSNQFKYMPEIYKLKYFKRLGWIKWTISDIVKKEVIYRRFNLMNLFPFKKSFHIIFCRNVMIYFDEIKKKQLIKKFANFTEQGSYLIISQTESLGRDNPYFKYVKPGIYERK